MVSLHVIVLMSYLASPLSCGRLASVDEAEVQVAVRRALTFLTKEVPAWKTDNKCYSCHNNGDAARALYRATGLKIEVPKSALEETTRWLEQPERWEHNGGEGPFSDKILARIQFAWALHEAMANGLSNDREALLKAAEDVVKDQKDDGSWRTDSEGQIGSPVTYGTSLATVAASRSLRAADPKRFAASLRKADDWLRKTPVVRVLDAASVMLGLEGADDRQANDQRQRCLETIQRGESPTGGWGPFANSPPEAFDTAVVILALEHCQGKDVEAMRQRGIAYLVKIQKPDGSWPETTRPPEGESYAQRLSTTGWATMALLTNCRKAD